jgi:hypothetical protein
VGQGGEEHVLDDVLHSRATAPAEQAVRQSADLWLKSPNQLVE